VRALRDARDPPIRYRDKPVPTPRRGPFCTPIRGPDCLPFDTNAPLMRPAFSCCRAAGWSNELSLGSIETAAWQRISRHRSRAPKRGSTSPRCSSSLGDWRQRRTTYLSYSTTVPIQIQTLRWPSPPSLSQREPERASLDLWLSHRTQRQDGPHDRAFCEFGRRARTEIAKREPQRPDQN